MKKLLASLVFLFTSCQNADCPKCEPVQVPTPPVCEADKAQMAEVAELKDELAAAKAELALKKATPKKGAK
jgi:hypothetical protein